MCAFAFGIEITPSLKTEPVVDFWVNTQASGLVHFLQRLKHEMGLCAFSAAV